MKGPNKAKLQRLIDSATSASNMMHNAHGALNEYCLEIYGATPGDVDADGIVDGCFGGCGLSVGIGADQFDREMRAAIGQRP